MNAFAAFELRRFSVRSEYLDPRVFKRVRHAVYQRIFRSDHDKLDVVVLRKGDAGFEIVRIEIDVFVIDRGAGIARQYEYSVRIRTLGQLPGDGGFSSAASDNEYVHPVLRVKNYV